MVVSLDALHRFAAAFWKEVGDFKIFAMHGGMGAGKTTTITALCRAKGVTGAISSPTFSIINEYEYNEHGVLKKLFHIDLYRLKSEEEVAQAGVDDCLYSGAVCFVEWPEIAPWLFDETAVHLMLQPVNATERLIKIVPAASCNSSMAPQS